jgi:hypothetical protein
MRRAEEAKMKQSTERCGVRLMSLQRVFLTFGAMMLVACAPTKVTDPPADHPASAQAQTRELRVLSKLEAPAIAASQPSSEPASQPSTQPASQPSEQPIDHSKHVMPAETTHDAHQHHEGGHQ